MDFLGFDRVKNAVEAARGSLDRARLFMCTPTRKVSTYREHQAIVGAIKRHDVNAAMRGMADHLDAVMTELIDFSERNPEAVSEVRETAAA
jgi:DNA-binding GntR family transcriptional regulator